MTRSSCIASIVSAAAVLWSAAAQAAALTAALTYPVNGATNVDLSQPLQWTAVPDVQAYYVYVGSTLGAKDLVNSGEVQETSYRIALPTTQTVYVRLWTKVANIWRFTDSTFSAAAVTAPLAATLTFPANGATNVNLSQPLQWPAIPNVQAYYVYVGSTLGAKDLVNSGELSQTSYRIAQLPTTQTVYVRLWTKVANIWRYTDSTFSASALSGSLAATLTYPVNGATDVDLSQPLQWTTVANAQAYYVYVGSTPGAKDLVNSGELQATSYRIASLPTLQMVYVRLWTKVAGIWRFTDSTFSGPLAARLTYPANGAANVDLSQPLQWAAIPNAQAYYVYVGTSLGAYDLVDSGEIQQSLTSYRISPPSTYKTLCVRLWTKVGGVWRSTDSTFGAAPLIATFTYPVNGATNVDLSQRMQWTTVPNAQAYYLYVGSTLGAKDFVDTGEIQDISALALLNLPPNSTLYARIWTKVGGIWWCSDARFSAGPFAAEFVYPLDGMTRVDPKRLFQWTAAIGAQAYRLYVGTAPGGSDVVDSGSLTGTSYLTNGLPSIGVLYGRIWTKTNGAWLRHSDIAFTLATPNASGSGGNNQSGNNQSGSGGNNQFGDNGNNQSGNSDDHEYLGPAKILTPADGTTKFDTLMPFVWWDVPLARAYRLIIGTTPGTNNVHDSGEIHIIGRFVPNLPVGVPLYGQVQTKIDNQWYTSDFRFSVARNSVSNAQQIMTALGSTAFVRGMASDDNRAFGWTALSQKIAPRYSAVSRDFTTTLLQVLKEVNIGPTAERLDVSFNATRATRHTLVELRDPDTLRWMILDPTFNLSARIGSTWATADEISQATLASNWSAISYQFLGPEGDSYVRASGLDYPLLYVNTYHKGQPFALGQGHSALPYLKSISLPASGDKQTYLIRCTSSTSTRVIIDGVSTQVPCDGMDATSAPFSASTVAAPTGTPVAFQLYRPRRFLF